MKGYYCKAIRSDGDECGETREDRFYEGRKSMCKHCHSKLINTKEKEKKRGIVTEEEEEFNKEILKMKEDIKYALSAKDVVQDFMRKMSKDIQEVKAQNDLYKSKIDDLKTENSNLNKIIRDLDKRIGKYEFKNYLRHDDPDTEEFEVLKRFKTF